ncbi:hypothetical protein [uncultured Phascolarctobacterium sp.]|uniref:hypothetical protein n=1 Tax=uncultured Phascolarctobacterium sp. TaxID=512296 RepID=UPI0026377157|nr:hypothetical protein [uncultured Phascolarctobacterium sp.]
MLTPDPKNHNRDYLINLEYLDMEELVLDFQMKYEKKLDKFIDEIQNLADSSYSYDQSPKDKLASFDKTYKYLDEKIKPFFIKMQDHYGEGIMQEFAYLKSEIDYVKADYLKNEYEDHQQEYEEYIQEQNHIKSIKAEVLKLLKKNAPMKQADLLRNFEKADATMIKKYIQELCIAGKVMKGRHSTSGKGAIFLVYISK